MFKELTEPCQKCQFMDGMTYREYMTMETQRELVGMRHAESCEEHVSTPRRAHELSWGGEGIAPNNTSNSYNGSGFALSPQEVEIEIDASEFIEEIENSITVGDTDE